MQHSEFAWLAKGEEQTLSVLRNVTLSPVGKLVIQNENYSLSFRRGTHQQLGDEAQLPSAH